MPILRWQFSVKRLLQLTAIVSVVLTFAVNLPVVFKIVLVVAALVVLLATIMASANFATSDDRPRLAVISWSLLGGFFAIYAVALLRLLFQGIDDVSGPILGILVMGTCSLVCILSAYRAYMLRAKPVRETEGKHKLAETNSGSAESPNR